MTVTGQRISAIFEVSFLENAAIFFFYLITDLNSLYPSKSKTKVYSSAQETLFEGILLENVKDRPYD